ncbi:MAG: hypothetical protein P4M09_14625 [Devosia sp.]|nr:hypothetical protein [Devosia sp.]
MTWVMTRRTMLAAVGAGACVVAVSGGGAAMRSLVPATQSPETEAADFVRLLADVHDDYVNGRVVEHAGWILSQHEFDTIGARTAERAHRANARLS